MNNLKVKYKDNFQILKDDVVIAELNYGEISHYHASGLIRGDRFTILPKVRHSIKAVSIFLQFLYNGFGIRNSVVEQNGVKVAEIRDPYFGATQLILKSSGLTKKVYKLGGHLSIRPSKDKYSISDGSGDKLFTINSKLNWELNYNLEVEFHKNLDQDLAVELLIYSLFCININLSDISIMV